MLSSAQLEFLRGLVQAWGQSPAHAILIARLNVRSLTPEMAQAVHQESMTTAERAKGGETAQMFAATYGLNNEPDAAVMAQAHEYYWLAQVLARIIASGGDPPTPPALQQTAFEVINGRGDPQNAALLGAESVGMDGAGLNAIMTMAQRVGADPGAVLARIGLAAAAMALPRAKLLQLCGQPASNPVAAPGAPAARPPAQDIHASVASLIAQAEKQAGSDPQAAERLMIKAIELTQKTPEPDDDLKAIRTLLLVCGRAGLSAETVRLCVLRLVALIDQGLSGDEAAQTLAYFGRILVTTEQSDTLSGPMTAGAEKLLAKPLGNEMRFTLGLTTAEAHARTGNHDKAERLLRGLKKLPLDMSQVLLVAQREADVYWNGNDHETAADVLCEALDKAANAPADQRMTALQKLISVAPADYPGLSTRIAEFTSSINACAEPERTMHRISLVQLLSNRGERDAALDVARLVDIKSVRRMVPSDFASYLDDVERGFQGILKELQKK